MNIERRKFVRHQIRPHTIFLFSNYSPVKGWVKDISEGGMAFEYSPPEECEPNSKINLILAGDALPFYLADISCKTIYDIKADKDIRPSRSTGIRHCGVQFARLDSEMKEKLGYLMSNESIMRNSEG